MASNDQVSDFSDEDGMLSQLQKLMECPVCYETMKETRICVNGHTICNSCREHILNNKCPMCTGGFGNIRNRLAESIAELLSYKPCSNAVRGCTQYVAEKDLRKHELGCHHRLYTCKLCSTKMCYMTLKRHCLQNHRGSVLQQFVSKVLTENDVIAENVYFSLIEFDDELFWFWRKYTNTNVFFGLQFCGETEKGTSYKYNFQLVSSSKKSNFEFTGPVLADVQNHNIYNYPEDYVILNKHFAGEGSEIQISVAIA